MKKLVYLIGEPGSGKSTLAELLFRGLPAEARKEPFAHVVHPHSIELGARREAFSGTDALPMNVQPKVVPMLVASECELFFAEGDRLANEKFFLACSAARIQVVPLLLIVPRQVAADRRAARGSNQNPTWVRGRVTKVANLWRTFGTKDRVLDGTMAPEEIAAALLARPVIAEMVAP